jgi:hypothetical protein
MKSSMQLLALVIVVILLIAAVGFVALDDDEEKSTDPTIALADEYMILVDEPTTEEELMIVAALSALVVRDTYHPMFILDDGWLDDHEIWTIEHNILLDSTKYLFTYSENTIENVKSQVSNVESFNLASDDFNEIMRGFIGFDGEISVASYRESLWVSPLANIQNRIITIGDSTFGSQEEVWDEMQSKGINADYVVVTNPEDYKGTEEFYTVVYDNEGNESSNKSYHIPTMSAVAAELAAYHHAYVLTDIIIPTNVSEEFGDFVPNNNPSLNYHAIGILEELRNISSDYGPIEYIALVGSAEAIPHFELPAMCDVAYAFLDDNEYTMDAALGRIVNYNVQGASNQIARTLGYDYIIDEVEVEYSDGSTRSINWRSHGADFNGFEVADMRGQNTPGLYASRDYEDEGYSFDYVSSVGVGTSGPAATNAPADADLDAYLQSSGHVLYRGHGSATGSYYTWRHYGPDQQPTEGSISGAHARELFIPPQVTLLFSCLNARIHEVGDMDEIFSTGWMYAGAVGMIAATEVTYSNIGQDVYGLSGEVTGEHNWDCNNLWFAGCADNTLNHEIPMGKVLMETENRYIATHDNQYSPFHKGSGAHYVEVTVYTLFGDPAFMYHVTSEGENNYDPWH